MCAEFLSKLRKAPGSSVAPAAESAAAAGVEPSPCDGPAVSLLKRSLSLASFPEVGSTATALAEDSAKVVAPGTVRTRIGSFGGGSGILVATPEVTDVDSGTLSYLPIVGLPPAHRCVRTWVGDRTRTTAHATRRAHG